MSEIELKIRKADARDFPFLYGIGSTTPEIQVTEGETFMELAEFLQAIQAESVFLVAEVNEVVAGFVYVRLDDVDAPHGWACLVYLVVRPEYRRHGVGTALYQSGERLARERGISNFYAWARCGQDSPIREVLKRQGYSEGHEYSWMGKWQRASVPFASISAPGMKRADIARLAWDCGDDLLERLRGADPEELRRAISEEVLAALQYHSTSDNIDHVIIYMSDDDLIVVDFQLPGCIRKIDVREVVGWEIEDAEDEAIAKMEELFGDLARKCRQARPKG